MSSVIRRTAKGGAGFVIANLINKGAALLFVLVATHLLGVDTFGLLALGLSVIALIQNVALFGLPLAAQRFLSGEGENDAQDIYGIIVIIGGCVSLFVSALCFFYANWIAASIFAEPALASVLKVLSFSLLFGLPYMLARSVIQAQERVKWIVTTDFIQKIGQIVIAVVLFLMLSSVEGVALGYVASYTAAFILALWYVWQLPIKPQFSRLSPALRKVMRYAAPTTFVSFSYLLAQQADKLMLGILSDATAVGFYTVAVSAGMIISVMHSSLVSVFMPIASQAYRDNDTESLRLSYTFVSKWLGAFGGVVVLLFMGFGTWLLSIFGPEYANAATYQVLMLISSLHFLGTWTGPTGALLLMANRQGSEVFNTMLFILTNIALNYFLIPIYGIAGAALATFISALLRKIIQVIEVIYWFKFKPFEPLRIHILLMVAAAFVLGMFLGDTVPYMRPAIAIVGMIGVTVYVLATSLPEERQMIMRLKAKLSF